MFIEFSFLVFKLLPLSFGIYYLLEHVYTISDFYSFLSKIIQNDFYHNWLLLNGHHSQWGI